MKTNPLKTSVAIVLSVMMFISCQKSEEISPEVPSNARKFSLQEIVSNPQFVKAYQQMEAKFRAESRNTGAQFIAPFFTSEGFGLGQNMVVDVVCDPLDPTWCYGNIVEGQMAFIYGQLGPKDLYRVNPDGTVTVRVNSNSANASHLDVLPNIEHTSSTAHLNMTYTGPVVSFDIYDFDGNFLFTVNFIDWYANNRSAISFHGNGKVRVGNSGPFKTLVSRWVASPGFAHETSGFTLN